MRKRNSTRTGGSKNLLYSLLLSSVSDIPILYEDNHILAINKPSSMLSQKDKTGDLSVLDVMKNFIQHRDRKKGNVFLGLPHRIDRPASGVLILAKTSKALSRLSNSFREGKIDKIYWAVVETPPKTPEGTLVHWLRKNGKTNSSHVTDENMKNAREARLRYRLTRTSERFHLIEVVLLTGRHHQIRVQLSSIGCPIRGDLKYGASRSNKGGGIDLHARKISFPHPTKNETLSIIAPPPNTMLWNFFANSGSDVV